MKSVFGIFLSLWAWSAHAEMGFLDLEDVPPAVQKVAPSVLQIMVPAGNIVARYGTADYPTEAFQNKIKTTADKHLVSQMDFCQIQKLEVCLIYDDMSMASSFVIFDSKHVATNRHVFWDYIQNLVAEHRARGLTLDEAYAKVTTQAFPVKIARNMKLVPSGLKSIRHLNWFQNESLISLAAFDQRAFGSFLSTDMIVVQTTEPVGEPLKVASTPVALGEGVYLLGYPTLTTNRLSTYGKKDSNGWAQLSLSYGRRLSVDEGLQRLSVMNSRIARAHEQIISDESLRQVWEEGVMITDADSEHGSSGGAVVNELGELVAMQSASLIEYRGSEPGLTISFACPLVTQLKPTLQLTLNKD